MARGHTLSSSFYQIWIPRTVLFCPNQHMIWSKVEKKYVIKTEKTKNVYIPLIIDCIQLTKYRHLDLSTALFRAKYNNCICSRGLYLSIRMPAVSLLCHTLRELIFADLIFEDEK